MKQFSILTFLFIATQSFSQSKFNLIENSISISNPALIGEKGKFYASIHAKNFNKQVLKNFYGLLNYEQNIPKISLAISAVYFKENYFN